MATRCPDPAELLRDLLADSGTGGDARLARHVAQCESCRSAAAQLRDTVNALRLSASQSDEATPDCLDEDWIAAFADGSVEPSESAPRVAHLLGCARCCRQVASVARLLDDETVGREAERLTTHRPATRRRALGAIAGVAAAAALLLVVGRSDGPPTSEPREPAYREPSLTGAAPPAPIAPVGEVSAVDSLRWTSVARANRYRLTVFDRNGTVAWETQTADTVVALPAHLALSAGATYLWRVEARAGWEDRWVASELTEFTVRRAPDRR